MKFEDYQEINKKAFDFFAERYAKREKRLEENWQNNFYKYLIDSFSNPHVLEIGCGSGFILKYFSEKGFKTTAIDISLEIIRNGKTISPSTNFIHSDFLDYDFGNNRLSGIVSENVLHLFPMNRVGDVLDKVYSLLDNEGIFYFSIPLFNEPLEEIIQRREKGAIFEFRTRYTRDKINQKLRRSRLKVIEEKTTQFKDSKGNSLLRLSSLLIKC